MKKWWAGLVLLVIVFSLVVPVVRAQVVPITAPTTTPSPTTAPGTVAWAFDSQVTEVGKRAERARQFISWILKNQAIDNHRVFMDLWKVTLGVTLTLTIIVVAMLGLGLIVARKQDISVKVDVMPILTKVAMIVLYAIFSYVLVLGLIQITELITSFFIKFLGGDKLFSIFFSADPSTDANYTELIGQRDLDPLKAESAKTSLFLIEVSSYTYFAMGIIILIRKIVLWFLLVLSPILALLMPFKFIRNIGWIWVGVFFQWAFYGPLFGIFLWALSKIWEAGIPFAFNFSRILGENGVVYPLAINILYGGPQQVAGGLGQPLSHQAPINSGNYIDTFMEYVIALIMLWVVMVLPWWLLRIFRDYCCDGIYAMKNILMNMLGAQQRPSEPPPGGLSSSLNQQIKQAMSQTKQVYQQETMKQQQIISEKENIKNVKTEEISRRMDANISRLADIAKLETQSDRRQNVSRTMSYMQNPMSAESREDRSQFVKLKAELSTRAAGGDVEAKRLLDATTSTGMMVRDKIQMLAKQQVSAIPITQRISIDLKLPEEKIRHIATTFAQTLSRQSQIITQVSQVAQVETQQTKQVIEAVPKAAEQGQKQSLEQVSKKAGLNKEKTKQVIEEVEKQTENEQVVAEVAQKEQATIEQVKSIGKKVLKAVGQEAPAGAPGKPAKPAVSIEEYEEMRRMWIEHYTKGEVPMTEKIKDRQSWVSEESVRLENVMNKIVSENEDIRAEGLREVSDIIPFFILGDMTLEDIAVYLRAKLAAAKEVSQNLQAENVIKQRLENQTEYVEVERQKTEAKADVLKQELPIAGNPPKQP
ncbi:hypothetical protein A2209_03345 [Candidatus Roizmanbacteria bacterium RIFOXYA1_FULL_41_12]|uniref:Uncharacterized protein n=1 Tax=Candidatus Roizmanbacteria bacterium RIFOXYA1_FULL_41_12 TaxID=1802082 RepID=A0A1F7K9Q1_9BACT|nr:MAG: hypothetical protein A2209_03345 [Candidatus Roizmanbacteria bacterium RIFOXYA1_FULL_41_12]